MSVIVFSENWKGEFRKSTFEAVSYGSQTARFWYRCGCGIIWGCLRKYVVKIRIVWASKIISVPSVYGNFDGGVVAKIISDFS